MFFEKSKLNLQTFRIPNCRKGGGFSSYKMPKSYTSGSALIGDEPILAAMLFQKGNTYQNFFQLIYYLIFFKKGNKTYNLLEFQTVEKVVVSLHTKCLSSPTRGSVLIGDFMSSSQNCSHLPKFRQFTPTKI